jgi:hypothetical protein
MKKAPFLLTTLFLLFISCNKIDTSQEVFEIISPVEITPWEPSYAATVIRKIYVEEFTGHTCTYCPDGAAVLKAIMDRDSTVIATAIHCTSLADPGKEPFQNNYKTPMGDMICSDFNISGLPKAMINRIGNGANKWGFDRNQWSKEIDKIDRTNPSAGIELHCTVDEAKQEIVVRAGVTVIKALPNPVQLCLVLQQDNLISAQIEGTGNYILDYVHNHVLRASFNRSYGIKLTLDGRLEEQLKYSAHFNIKYDKPFPHLQLPVVIKHCSVVAYLIDMETKEVLQVECEHLGRP